MDCKINEKKVSLEEAIEQVRKVCKRLALLHLSFSKEIINELGEVKGEKLILKAIKDYGVRIGKGVKETVSKQGFSNNPENYKRGGDRDLPLYGMHDRTEAVVVNGEKRSRDYGCVMGKVWKELGEGKIGKYYCYVDPAKYMTFNPNYKLTHTKSIPNGDEYCEFKIEPTTKKEREDFFEKDINWSYIDKY